MAFNNAKITVKRARAEAVYNPDAISAAGLRVSGAEVKPTVQAVAKLLDASYPRDDLFYDTDLGHIQLGALVGLEATTALIRELEVRTGKAGWYEKKSMVYDVIEATRRRSPHAAMLLAGPKDHPAADLSPWTSRFTDPEFALGSMADVGGVVVDRVLQRPNGLHEKMIAGEAGGTVPRTGDE